jgi:soluble lytic murein transglycosylase-like protein
MKMTSIALLAALAASPVHAGDLRAAVRKSALHHGVPPELAHGVASVESGYRNVRSSDGLSMGIMQVRPSTARGVGVHGSQMVPANSIEAGMRYLAQALKKFGNWCVAASAFNRGLYARPRCTAYGRRVLALSRRHYASVED